MRKTHLAILLTSFAALLAVIPDASAFYHPQAGRWIQRDPEGYVDGMSLYEYVQSGPITKVDPLGLMFPWPTVFHLVGHVAAHFYEGAVKDVSGRGRAGLDAKLYCTMNGRLKGTVDIVDPKAEVHRLSYGETPTFKGVTDKLTDAAVDATNDIPNVKKTTASSRIYLRLSCTEEKCLRYEFRSRTSVQATMDDGTKFSGSEDFPLTDGTFDKGAGVSGTCCR